MEMIMEIIVEGLVRDGATTWICDIVFPWGTRLKHVYLVGTTEEEAYQCLQNLLRMHVIPTEDTQKGGGE